jgi:HEAT repeat protein
MRVSRCLRVAGLSLVAVFGFAVSFNCCASDILDNAKVLKMVREGVALDVIVKLFASATCRFDASSEALIEVQKAGKDGNWKAEDITKLQHEVIRIAGLDQKRLKELVDKAVNTFENAQLGDNEYEMTMRGLVREGRPIVSYMLKHVEDESERKRGGVADSLGRIGDKSDEVVLAVTLMLCDRSKPVRLQAAKAVSALRNEATCRLLAERLNNPNDKVDGLAMALGYLRDAQGIDPLAKLLRYSADTDARVCAAWALGNMRARTNNAVEALLEAVLDDRDQNLRNAAAEALARIGDKRAPAFIMKAFQRFQRAGGVDLLGHLDVFKDIEVAEFLIDQMESDNPGIKKAAKETFARLTGEPNLDSAEEARGWLEVNRQRPDWIRSNSSGPKLPEPRSGEGSMQKKREGEEAVPTSLPR